MKFPKKSLGQNFLIDKNIIRKIVALVKIRNKNIIEIGAGKGALTDEILSLKPRSITLIEKDENLSQELKEKYFKNKNVKVITADVLKFNLEKEVKANSIIFGNLPYNISSQILVKILRFETKRESFSDLILMFQKELADKITGKFNSINYSRISILSNYKLDVIKKFLVSYNCFFPKPKVTSEVIHFKPKKMNKYKIKNICNLEKVTQIIFSNKRKMINKRIKKVLTKTQIEKIGKIKLNLRPADIEPEIYYKITELFEKN